MTWRIADLTSAQGEISSTEGGFRFVGSGASWAELSMLLLGPEVVIGPSVLQDEAQFGVPVLLCDWKGIPVSCAAGVSAHTRTGRRQRKQALATESLNGRLWRRVVQAKILGQSNVLRGAGYVKQAEELVEYSRKSQECGPREQGRYLCRNLLG